MPVASPRRRSVVGVVCAVACAALLTSTCRRAGDHGPVVVAFDGVAVSLDPHLQNHSIAWSVLGNIYDGLVRFTPTMGLEPALAVAWDPVDERTWVMGLRPGVRFHDGSKLTSADVVRSLERARTHSASLVKHHLAGVEQVVAVDDLTVEIRLSGPVPDLLNRLTFVYVVPEEAAGEAQITQPLGTGPYRFVGRTEDGSVSVEAVQGWRGLAEIGAARFEFFEDGEEAADEFFAGRVDLLHILPEDRVTAVAERPGLGLRPQPRLAVQMLAIAPHAATGRSSEALDDPRVRRALLLGLNRSAWANSVFRGNATVASQYVHPVVFGYDPTIAIEPYDPAEARRLLAEAGFEDGFEVTLGHGFVTPANIAAIVADLARIGVRVDVKAASFADILRQARGGELPLVYYAWSCSTGDASDFLNSSVHSRDPDSGFGAENYTGYSDPETDALLGLAEVEQDPEVRRRLLQDAQRRALAARMVLPLMTPWAYLGVSSRIEVESRHDDRIWLAAYRWSS